MKVIGAGFPRTGTTTLKKALSMLGFAGCYHFKDLVADPSRLKYWEELEETGNTDFEALFDGYQSTSDFPAYPYYKILLEKYPDAKVILSMRDFESWHESNMRTIWQVHKDNGPIKFMRQVYYGRHFGGEFDNKEAAEKIFNAHLEEVKNHVPKEQLLAFEVTEGWEPLCQFLGVPVPEAEFPHLNKKSDFEKMLAGMLQKK